MAFPLSHTFRTRNIYVYLLFLSGTAYSLQSSYCSVWRTERNVRTVNARGAPSLIRCKRSKLNETYGPCERCLRFVTTFTVRTDLVRTVDQKLRTVTERVYWTCVSHVRGSYNGPIGTTLFFFFALDSFSYLCQGCALRKFSGSPSGSQPCQLGCPALQVGRPK